MTEERQDTTTEPDSGGHKSFDRWALLGAAALAAVGFAAFSARHGSPTAGPAGDDPSGGASLLHVRIGGERPASLEGQALQGIPEEVPDETPDTPPAPYELNGDPPPDDGGAPDPATRTVTVRSGETLGQIVQRELGSISRLDEVVRLNGIADPDNVQAGTELLLPVE